MVLICSLFEADNMAKKFENWNKNWESYVDLRHLIYIIMYMTPNKKPLPRVPIRMDGNITLGK